MRNIFAAIVVMVIISIAGIVSMFSKVLVEVSRSQMVDIGQFQFVAMGMIPFVPFLIAVWLSQWSWKKITTKKEPSDEN